MKKADTPSLADAICDTRTRKIKTQFFGQINALIDWKPVKQLIQRHYTKRKKRYWQTCLRWLTAL